MRGWLGNFELAISLPHDGASDGKERLIDTSPAGPTSDVTVSDLSVGSNLFRHLYLATDHCRLQIPQATRAIRRTSTPPNATAKMSISNEALQKLIQEIELKSIQAQQQITMVRSQQAARQREMRLAQLTRSEISSLPADTPVYEGLGKMFVAIPVSAMDDKLGKQVKDLETDIEGLGKRLHYLETTAKNSQSSIDKILRRGDA